MKCAWITGAERSLGLGIKEYFEKSNTNTLNDGSFRVIPLSRPDWELSADPEYLVQQTEELIKSTGFPDVVIHNAGRTNISWAEDASLKEFESVIRVNLTSRFAINKAIIAESKRTGKSVRIIHVISMASRVPLRQSSAYCASKSADHQLVRQLAKEVAGRIPGVMICGVSPGGIQNTLMLEDSIQHLIKDRGMTEDQARKYNVASPLGRNATQEEVAKVVYFLAVDAPEYMHGSIVEVGGAVA